jgi:hypothetical protein
LAHAPSALASSPDAATLAKIDQIFADYALDAHVPGVVYGVVADDRLV